MFQPFACIFQGETLGTFKSNTDADLLENFSCWWRWLRVELRLGRGCRSSSAPFLKGSVFWQSQADGTLSCRRAGLSPSTPQVPLSPGDL